MKHNITYALSLAVAMFSCYILWITLAILSAEFWSGKIDVLSRSPWLIRLFVLSDAPLLLPASAIAILIFRRYPCLLGVICGLMAIISVTVMTTGSIFFKPIFLTKWLLFIFFALAGTYVGWWILKPLKQRNTTLHAWQSLAVGCSFILGLAAFQWIFINIIMDIDISQ